MRIADQDPPPGGTITYRLVIYLPTALTVVIGLGGVATALVLNFFLANPPDTALRLFELVWLAFYVSFAYLYLFRFAYEVGVVDGSTLRWRSVLGHGEVPLTRVKSIKMWRPPFGSGAKKIAVEGARSPIIMVSGGITDVLEMFTRFRPDLVSQIDWYDRMAERMAYPRSWGWRRVVRNQSRIRGG
jgi:hypothetical protein